MNGLTSPVQLHRSLLAHKVINQRNSTGVLAVGLTCSLLFSRNAYGAPGDPEKFDATRLLLCAVILAVSKCIVLVRATVTSAQCVKWNTLSAVDRESPPFGSCSLVGHFFTLGTKGCLTTPTHLRKMDVPINVPVDNPDADTEWYITSSTKVIYGLGPLTLSGTTSFGSTASFQRSLRPQRP